MQIHEFGRFSINMPSLHPEHDSGSWRWGVKIEILKHVQGKKIKGTSL